MLNAGLCYGSNPIVLCLFLCILLLQYSVVKLAEMSILTDIHSLKLSVTLSFSVQCGRLLYSHCSLLKHEAFQASWLIQGGVLPMMLMQWLLFFIILYLLTLRVMIQAVLSVDTFFYIHCWYFYLCLMHFVTFLIFSSFHEHFISSGDTRLWSPMSR